ncbi:MFS transporter [Legionella septentrionalis]|uniref:MFS transporter n=1 Tax=Legionella septentrionalis TaxID=2498109 RepID=UPI000F8D39D1|nr:MFS transporter [Legionella septentrionalis]RUR17452.1 MFS transporter [Legionella septentrionalis]
MIAVSLFKARAPLGIWWVGVSFVLFQFFMQLSSGVVIGAIMHDMQLSALTAGWLGSAFYIVYTGLQIPVGIMFDRGNTRLLLAVNAFICSLGCLLFAASHTLPGLLLGRVLIGMGSAFAFVGFSHLLRQHFPLRKFAFMIGLSETLAFLVTVMGMISMGTLLQQWGWRGFINGAGIIGLLISFLCWKYLPDSAKTAKIERNYTQQLLKILKNGKAWVNGCFVGLSFALVTVFGALWAIPFLQVKLNCTLPEASILGAVFFLGAGVSCPLFGILSSQMPRRKPLILSSCISTNLLLLITLYCPIQNPLLIGILMFFMGCCCGAYMLAFTIANELAPENSLSTCTGFTNTLAVISAPLLQPLVGYLLDTFGHKGAYTLHDYHLALAVVPMCLLIATVLAWHLPESYEK